MFYSYLIVNVLAKLMKAFFMKELIVSLFSAARSAGQTAVVVYGWFVNPRTIAFCRAVRTVVLYVAAIAFCLGQLARIGCDRLVDHYLVDRDSSALDGAVAVAVEAVNEAVSLAKYVIKETVAIAWVVAAPSGSNGGGDRVSPAIALGQCLSNSINIAQP